MAPTVRPATWWRHSENEALVADYLDMLELELAGRRYQKAAHNRALRSTIDRSEGAIEYKHQNVSAVLHQLGQPSIKGYLPASNYQSELVGTVSRALDLRPSLLDLIASAAKRQIDRPLLEAHLAEEDPPQQPRMPAFGERAPHQVTGQVRPLPNFLELESRNRSIGDLGELLVLHQEERRLRDAGRSALAARIEHVAASHAGHGYDIASFEANGEPRLIEVKTTQFSAHTPIFISRNEVRVSEDCGSSYMLARVYDVRGKPRFFATRGALGIGWDLDPLQYQGRIR